MPTTCRTRVEVETPRGATPHLVVPYTLDTNDSRFTSPRVSTAATSSSAIKGFLRHALRRRRSCGARCAEDALDRAALPDRRPAGARCLARAVRRLRALARSRLVRPTHRHRPALDRYASVRACGMSAPPASFPRRRESSDSSLPERRWVPAFAGTTTAAMVRPAASLGEVSTVNLLDLNELDRAGFGAALGTSSNAPRDRPARVRRATVRERRRAPRRDASSSCSRRPATSSLR